MFILPVEKFHKKLFLNLLVFYNVFRDNYQKGKSIFDITNYLNITNFVSGDDSLHCCVVVVVVKFNSF